MSQIKVEEAKTATVVVVFADDGRRVGALALTTASDLEAMQERLVRLVALADDLPAPPKPSTPLGGDKAQAFIDFATMPEDGLVGKVNKSKARSGK